MSVTTFLKDAESGAEKVAAFVVKQMTAAEDLLAAHTGSAKANIVITAVEGALTELGLPVTAAQSEVKTVLSALTALFNKLGLFTTSSSTPPTA